MKVGVIGLGYVGLPLAVAFAEAGDEVVGVDVDARVVTELSAARSRIEDVSDDRIAAIAERFTATSDHAALADCDGVLICVPTPLANQREPDLSYIVDATRALAGVLRAGQLVVLESTTYPGTTRDRVLPILEESGLTAGTDFHLAFSPERIDPGRTDHTIRTTPKVVGGVDPGSTERAAELYGRICDEVVQVSTPEAAELTKLLENVFRSVNIALVNELAVLCDRMGIDIWEVVDAAATKPFGFMRFEPGPGMGGHCLPVDPFYLAFKAREYDFPAEFIELAGKINQQQPHFCVEKLGRALNDVGKPVRGSRILVLGVSYKAGVADIRESPALRIIRLLRDLGGEVSYHDPHVPEVARARPPLVATRRGARRMRRRLHRHRASPRSTTSGSSPRRRWWSTSAVSPARSKRPTSSGSRRWRCYAGIRSRLSADRLTLGLAAAAIGTGGTVIAGQFAALGAPPHRCHARRGHRPRVGRARAGRGDAGDPGHGHGGHRGLLRDAARRDDPLQHARPASAPASRSCGSRPAGIRGGWWPTRRTSRSAGVTCTISSPES